MFKKKTEKTLRYKDDWFMSEVMLGRDVYYSRDGFKFKGPIVEFFTIESILKLSPAFVKVLAIENASGDVISLGDPRWFCSLTVEAKILTLNITSE